MNVNSSNVNFGARKVLISTQKLKSGTENVVEVFLLKKGEDDSFVKTYINTLNENKGRQNLKQKRLINIFRRFLTYESGINDFYVAIKNGEQIDGGSRVLPMCNLWSHVKDLVSLTRNKQTESSLWKAIINTAQKDLCKTVEWYNNSQTPIKLDDKTSLKTVLPDKSENIKFKEYKRQNKINLLDYLDIDFQDRA